MLLAGDSVCEKLYLQLLPQSCLVGLRMSDCLGQLTHLSELGLNRRHKGFVKLGVNSFGSCRSQEVHNITL